METTKLILDNYAVKKTPYAVKPSFVVTPDATTNGPASNLLVNDRAVRWNAIGTAEFTLDLGAIKSINVIGLLSLRRGINVLSAYSWYVTATEGPKLAVTTSGTTLTRSGAGNNIADGVKVGQPISGDRIAANTVVLAVTPTTVTMSNGATSNGSTTVTFGFVQYPVPPMPLQTSLQSEDTALILGSSIDVRYITFVINSTDPFALGKVLVSKYLDLGIAYSPGSSETRIKRGVTNESVEGNKTFTQVGPDGYAFNLQFAAVPDLIKVPLFNALDSGRVITLIHPTKGICEAFLVDDSLTANHRWASPNVWDISMNLETLP